ncbi:MAG: hypothetical protein H0T71_14320, partial [Acidobacteria bacterium]|nr:hypothetical protein [Acidobacteriota bacterium]
MTIAGIGGVAARIAGMVALVSVCGGAVDAAAQNTAAVGETTALRDDLK